jgi:hypothetical protein
MLRTKNLEITIYDTPSPEGRLKQFDNQSLIFHFISLSLPHQLEGRWRTWSVKERSFSSGQMAAFCGCIFS